MNASTQDKLGDFFSSFKPFHYRKGEVIIHAQDSPQGIYYVNSGYIQMYSIFEDGRELILNIFKPTSYFPMMWGISNVPNIYYFRTMVPTVLRRAGREKVLNFLNENPDELLKLTRRILIGLDGLLINIQHLLSGDAYHRVTSALLLCARRFGEKIDESAILVKLPLTHQDIANLVAVTRETASVEMKRIERKKLISYNNRLIVINNIRRLERESLIDKDSKSSLLTL